MARVACYLMVLPIRTRVVAVQLHAHRPLLHLLRRINEHITFFHAYVYNTTHFFVWDSTFFCVGGVGAFCPPLRLVPKKTSYDNNGQ